MRVSLGTLVGGCSTGPVPAQPHARTNSDRNGPEDSSLVHTRNVRRKRRRPQRIDQTIARGVGAHPVQTPRNMKGPQPFACI